MTQNVILLGILIITFGLLFLSCLIQGYAANQNGVKFMFVFCMIWGGLLLLKPIMSELLKCRDYGVYVFVLGFSLMFLLLGIYTGIIKIKQCTEKITATYEGSVAYRSKSITHYTPQFCFQYRGRTYHNTTGELFTKRKINKKFIVKNQYQIYLNPHNPYMICVRRRMGWGALLMILIGIVLILMMLKI